MLEWMECLCLFLNLCKNTWKEKVQAEFYKALNSLEKCVLDINDEEWYMSIFILAKWTREAMGKGDGLSDQHSKFLNIIQKNKHFGK